MNYATQISTSGVLGAMYRQDVLTNNLANLNTAGFKPDAPVMRFRESARVEDGLGFLPGDKLLESLGAGLTASHNTITFDQGPIEMTGNPLDVAIQGDGFFSVQVGDETRLSRDGRFSMGSDGTLRSSASGWAVLDDRGAPIELDPSQPVSIGAGGEVVQGGQTIAVLGLSDVADRSMLTKAGDGTFEALTGSRIEARATLVQGAIEGSAVNEIDALMQVTDASSSVRSNIGMITYHDRLMDQAINTFGRTS